MNAAGDAGGMFSLAARTYLVTGASSGIGRAVAVHLLREGARVAALARRRALLEDLAREAGSVGDPDARLYAAAADVRDAAQVAAAVAEGAARLGPYAGAVLAAGTNVREGLEDVAQTHWQEILATNLTGAFHSLRALLAHASRDGASVVAVGSLSAQIAYRRSAAYAASKAGLTQFARVAAVELAPRGVRVNVLAPGRIATPLTEPLMRDAREQAWMAERIPMGRTGTVDDLVGPIHFLLSDASRYITGAVLTVDGGWSASA
jgi:NAD(P)-dependent dehydrogenase (short-subunit alcohol dehydrogenase family)